MYQCGNKVKITLSGEPVTLIIVNPSTQHHVLAFVNMSEGLEQPQHDTNALLTGNGGQEGAATLRTIEAKNNSLVLFSVI